jgi:hypothetical protein
MFDTTKLIIACALAACLAAAGYGIYLAGYQNAERKYQLEISQANEQAQTKYAALEAQNRKIEDDHRTAITQIETEHRKKLTRLQHEKDDAIADALLNGMYLDATCESLGAELPKTGGAPGPGYTTGRARLSDPAAEFLIAIASEADERVTDLNKCRSQLLDDRK